VIPHFWVYVTTVVLGLTVLAWPEEDSRMLLTLSERQGPSALDLFGLTSRPSWWCPRFCALATDKIAAAGFPMPSWQDAIARWLVARDAVPQPN